MAVLGLRYLIFLNARHRLLCEVLKPGMSESEVLIVLKQTGDFTMSRGEWGNGDIVLSISFTDAKVRDRYGFFSVVFFDYKYARAVVSHGSDNPEIICDFYKATQSVTETPKP
jgi:hypothetical protein